MTEALKGLVALVTGAKGNIGHAITVALAHAGATVIGTDVGMAETAVSMALDVTSQAAWAAVLDKIETRFGRLDVLVNNAGVAPMARLEDVDLAEWRRCHAVNVEGPFLGMKAALPLLRKSGADRAGGSSIINIASAAANRAAAMSSVYCSSKAAVAMLTKAAAVEFGSLGYPVRANTINPGVVESDMIDGIVSRYAEILGTVPKEALYAKMRGDIPMGRLARPDDIADAAVFLASEAARFVHGTEFHVDGGYTAQ